jgi:hypothetical protein
MLVAAKGLQAQALLPGEIAQLKLLTVLIEQRADTTCPSFAPQLHESAARIRDSVKADDIDLVTRALDELGAVIRACHSAKGNPAVGAGTQQHDL